MRNKPSSCAGCPLETKGIGFAPPVGPKNSPLVFVGEALGRVEAQTGIPFSGPSGALLDRLLKRVGLDRGEVRIANCVSCQPPNDWLDGAPWEAEALAHCHPNLEAVLEENHRAVVALGGSATRSLLLLPRKGHIQENWHGCPIPLPPITSHTRPEWVVPTFHPAFLLRGNQKLIGTVCYDIQKAIHACKADYTPSKVSLVVDPPVEWFKEWVDAFCDSRDSVWLAVDIETTGKAVNEGEQKPLGVYEDQIIRINFSCNPDEGITVPFLGQYLPLIGRLLHSGHPLCFWNARFDVPRLEAAGFSPAPVLDFMWGWHVLQSDLPRGLGFVAPFYSDVGPWKHLSGTDPGTYAAIDAVQTIRLAFGITNDLLKSNQFDVFLRHVCEMDEKVLHPAEKVGLKVDLEKLETFRLSLQKKEDALAARISELVPEEVCPVKEWKRRPEDEQAVAVVVSDLAGCCRSCGAVEVARTHRCRDRSLQPHWEIREAQVTRWRKRLPFNPSSNKQLLGYIQSKGWKGGKAKKAKTDEPSVDRKTIQDLIRRTHDPVLPLVLEHRQIGKVLGTYVEGTYRRLGYVQTSDGFIPQHPSDGRVHPQFLHKPSTLRLSCVPLDTEILTLAGWKRHDQLVLGELVVGYDLVTDKLKLTPLEGVHHGREQLGHLRLRRHKWKNGIDCTAKHVWVAQNTAVRGVVCAEHVNHYRNFSLLLAPGDGLPDGGNNLSPTEAAIVGWAITDGHIRATTQSGSYHLTVLLSKPKSIAAFKALVANTPHTTAEYERPDCQTGSATRFYLGTGFFSPLWQHVQQWGRLDRFVLSLSQAARVAMYEAMMEADGCRARGTERFGAQKEEVKDAFCALVMALGKRLSHSNRRGGFTDYHIQQDRSVPARFSAWEPGEVEDVWCPKTGCGTWVARSPAKYVDKQEGDRRRQQVGHVFITGNCVAPNLTNIITDRDGAEAPAAGFRGCLVAEDGCVLIEADYSAIEAVETGWFAGDPDYIRLAKLGVHAYLASHLIGRPADLKWSDENLGGYFKELKKSHKQDYDRAKRVVHGCVSGDHEVLTPQGWVRFDALSDKSPIAVWNPDTHVIKFEVPERITRDEHVGPMVSLDGRSFSLFATPEHRLAWKPSYSGGWREIQVQNLPDYGRLPLTGNLDGEAAWGTDLQLAVALQADGSIYPGGHASFHLKKQRKIARLRKILGGLKVQYTETTDHSKKGRFSRFYLPKGSVAVTAPWLDPRNKTFRISALLKLNAWAKSTFIAELLEWDGASTDREPNPKRVRREYLTTNYHNAVVAQTLAHTSETQGLLRESSDNEKRLQLGRNRLYRVSFNRREAARVEKLQRTDLNFDGTVYCVTVSTGHFLIRYRDRVSVTMNTNYGLTPIGMVNNYPDLFSRESATRTQALYFDLCPKLQRWQKSLRDLAHKQNYLGGRDHPFGYRHWFWSVYVFNSRTRTWALGEDSKRVVAFYPQSTSAGVIKEAALGLMDPSGPNYIGDVFSGKTPIRALVHDSILVEVPKSRRDEVVEKMWRQMTLPITVQPCPKDWAIGTHLSLGVAVKYGTDWQKMDEIDLKEVGVGSDTRVTDEESEEDE